MADTGLPESALCFPSHCKTGFVYFWSWWPCCGLVHRRSARMLHPTVVRISPRGCLRAYFPRVTWGNAAAFSHTRRPGLARSTVPAISSVCYLLKFLI